MTQIGHQKTQKESKEMPTSGDFNHDFTGVWWLISREDRAADGSIRIDPTLGPDAKGILTYANGRFAAQFMKRDRSDVSDTGNPTLGKNNTGAVGGYDAYFGTYSVNEETGDVLHCLEGALTAENVGMEVSRTLAVNDDSLVIQLETKRLKASQ